MAKNDNLSDFLTDVADAIRAKKGTSDPINPQDFSDEIASIESGGGGEISSATQALIDDLYANTIVIPSNDEYSHDITQNTWAQIKEAFDSGKGKDIWLPGDIVNITLTDGRQVPMRLVDTTQGRYSKVSGSGSSNAVFESVDAIDVTKLLSGSTTVRDYTDTLLYSTENAVYNLLPSEVKNVIAYVSVPYKRAGYSTTNYASCRVFPASSGEMGGYGYNEGDVFGYYDGLAESKRGKSYNGKKVSTWTRSGAFSTSHWGYLASSGTLTSLTQTSTSTVYYSICFAI